MTIHEVVPISRRHVTKSVMATQVGVDCWCRQHLFRDQGRQGRQGPTFLLCAHPTAPLTDFEVADRELILELEVELADARPSGPVTRPSRRGHGVVVAVLPHTSKRNAYQRRRSHLYSLGPLAVPVWALKKHSCRGAHATQALGRAQPCSCRVSVAWPQQAGHHCYESAEG